MIVLLQSVSNSACKLSSTHFCVFAGNKAVLQFDLSAYRTKSAVLAAVDRIPYLGQSATNTTGAFRLARLDVFERSLRERPAANRVAVLITDGAPTEDTDRLEVEVARLKALGVDVVAVGVTSAVITNCYHYDLL